MFSFSRDLAQHLEHLRLDGDVERRRRLVGEQHARARHQAHRDHDPLLHAARELVRVAAQRSLRVADPDLLEPRDRLRARRRRATASGAGGRRR